MCLDLRLLQRIMTFSNYFSRYCQTVEITWKCVLKLNSSVLMRLLREANSRSHCQDIRHLQYYVAPDFTWEMSSICPRTLP